MQTTENVHIHRAKREIEMKTFKVELTSEMFADDYTDVHIGVNLLRLNRSLYVDVKAETASDALNYAHKVFTKLLQSTIDASQRSDEFDRQSEFANMKAKPDADDFSRDAYFMPYIEFFVLTGVSLLQATSESFVWYLPKCDRIDLENGNIYVLGAYILTEKDKSILDDHWKTVRNFNYEIKVE